MKTTASRPKIVMSSDGSGLISHSGALLLLETLRVTGLDQALSEQLQRWRPARAIHDPGKIIADLAVSLALGGDCLADIATLRSQPEPFGPLASDPTVSRLIDRLATDTAKALTAIHTARAIARERTWTLAGPAAPGADDHLIPIDPDAIRTDSGGGTHEFLTWLTRPGRWLKYSIGFTITDDIEAAILRLPATAWTPAYDADGQARAGAWVAEITALPNLTTWPAKMRVIAGKERPHPGARPRFTDPSGHRFT